MSEKIARKGERERSYSRSRSYSDSRSRSGSYRSYSRSRSPSYDDRRYSKPQRDRESFKDRPASYRPPRNTYEEPTPCNCLGVFGLSLYTQERDLRDIFSKYGNIDNVVIIYDHNTRKSRGFGFVSFESVEEATYAKEKCAGLEIDGRRIRVDFSITQRAHTPTPGVYMGKPSFGPGFSQKRTPSPYYGKSKRNYGRHSRSRSYSPKEIFNFEEF